MGDRVQRRISRDALLFTGLVIGIMQGAGLSPTIDSVVYWQANLHAAYPIAWTNMDPVYVYPPPLAQLIAPLHILGYGLYQALFTTALFACLWYCAGIWSWLFVALGALRAFVPALPGEVGAVLGYAMTGNIQLLIAAAIVASFRWPGAMALPLLTKPTMGIGIAWFAFRREWRRLLVALAVTCVVGVVSLVFAPGLWADWFAFALRNANPQMVLAVVPVPLPIRLAMSLALLAWAAPHNRRWALPVAVGWAMPVLYPGAYLAIWIGAIRLSGWADRLPRFRQQRVAPVLAEA